MRDILITIGIILVMIANFSCSEDSNDYSNEVPNVSKNDTVYKEDVADYYVKYEVAIQPANYITNSEIEIITEKGVQYFNMVSPSFSEVFGPVEKGFTASINAYLASQANNKEFAIRIYVCRGNEPFVLKAYNYSTENSSPLSAMYQIDY